jgi:lipopolysaccharide export LptBFGC system permease protein LptF
MSAPGSRLRALAAHVCSQKTMERLVDPIVADLQIEYAAAGQAGWRRLQVRYLAYVGFWRALIVHAALSTLRPAASDDESSLSRILGFSVLVFVVFTTLLVLPPLLDVAGRWEDPRLYLLLIPQALPLSLPAGVCLGVLCAMRARSATLRRLSVVLTIGAFATCAAWALMEWGVPWANSAWRDLMATAAAGRTIHLEPGLNELGLSRLGQRTDGEAVRHYHLLWALCFATIPLSVVALGLARRIRRLSVAILLATAACFGYVVVIMSLDNLRQGTLPLIVAAAWAPNLVFVALGVLLLGVRRGGYGEARITGD